MLHHRLAPVEHRFVSPMTQIWIDPDRPEELFDRHRLWSARRPAPVRFRRRDYLDGDETPLGRRVRDRLQPALGRRPTGPLRMLTQPRVWGWLFNPLTVYLAWADAEGGADGDPVAALLEVSNTPWHERHWYAVALRPAPPDGAGTGPGRLVACFAKSLHVSPFLTLDHRYHLGLGWTSDGSGLDLSLDVVAEDGRDPVLRTRLTTRLCPASDPVTVRAMGAVLRPDRLSTLRVSAGIHRQAAALWRKGVSFVPHPGKDPR